MNVKMTMMVFKPVILAKKSHIIRLNIYHIIFCMGIN